MATFSFLKFVQILNLPFFLSTIIMGDNHVTFYIDSVNPIANNIFISCLTDVT
jgi:hypothetical protein